MSEFNTDQSTTPPLGLVTGLGMGAGIFYYRNLVEQLQARGIQPNLLMVHADVRYVLGLVAIQEVDQLAAYFNGLLHQLASAGAAMATIPAFAPQICANQLSALSPLPLIDILDAIRQESSRRAFQRVAIFGARATIETRLFGRLEDLAEVVPLRAEEMNLVTDLYANFVYRQRSEPAEREALCALASRLISRERLDGIVLAGTDFAVALDPADIDFPHVDGARTHLSVIVHEIQQNARLNPHRFNK